MGSTKALASADWGSIALVTLTAAMGIAALAGGFQVADLLGFGLLSIVLFAQWFRKPSIAIS